MDNKIIDGKLISEQIKKEIAAEVADMIDHGIAAPHLAAVIVGEDGASKTYVASKEKACLERESLPLGGYDFVGLPSARKHLREGDA